jgi:hypothetical protein
VFLPARNRVMFPGSAVVEGLRVEKGVRLLRSERV